MPKVSSLIENRFAITFFNNKDKIPTHLIYKKNSFGIPSSTEYYWEEFVAFPTNGSKGYGMMVCHKHNMSVPRKDYNGDVLLIDCLMSNKSGEGYGTTLINFAKNYSKQQGCNGYILLKADPSFTPNRTPHVFYRKNGFGTDDIKKDKLLDKLIKQNKDSNYKDFPTQLMYYPPIYPPKRPLKDKLSTLVDKVLKFIKLK